MDIDHLCENHTDFDDRIDGQEWLETEDSVQDHLIHEEEVFYRHLEEY